MILWWWFLFPDLVFLTLSCEKIMSLGVLSGGGEGVQFDFSGVMGVFYGSCGVFWVLCLVSSFQIWKLKGFKNWCFDALLCLFSMSSVLLCLKGQRWVRLVSNGALGMVVVTMASLGCLSAGGWG